MRKLGSAPDDDAIGPQHIGFCIPAGAGHGSIDHTKLEIASNEGTELRRGIRRATDDADPPPARSTAGPDHLRHSQSVDRPRTKLAVAGGRGGDRRAVAGPLGGEPAAVGPLTDRDKPGAEEFLHLLDFVAGDPLLARAGEARLQQGLLQGRRITAEAELFEEICLGEVSGHSSSVWLKIGGPVSKEQLEEESLQSRRGSDIIGSLSDTHLEVSMSPIVAGIIITVVAIAIVVWIILTYNRLIRLRIGVNNGYSQIDVQLKRRYDLIPNLVETVKGYASHERQTLEGVISARNKAIQVPSDAAHAGEKGMAEGFLTQALGKLFALSEAYPDLKANTNFLNLQEELSSTENRIGFARQHYNDTVARYETARQSIPSNIVAGAFNFKKLEYFVLEEAAQREAPKVSFT